MEKTYAFRNTTEAASFVCVLLDKHGLGVPYKWHDTRVKVAVAKPKAYVLPTEGDADALADKIRGEKKEKKT